MVVLSRGISARFRARTTVNEAAISSFFQPGGDVFREMQRFNRWWKAAAIVTAPKRSGWLAAHHQTRALPGGIYGCHSVLINDAFYSTFVHDGTTGPIRSRSGKLMPIRGGQGFARYGIEGSVVFRQTVSGQRSQPWMVDAMQSIMVQYQR